MSITHNPDTKLEFVTHIPRVRILGIGRRVQQESSDNGSGHKLSKSFLSDVHDGKDEIKSKEIVTTRPKIRLVPEGSKVHLIG